MDLDSVCLDLSPLTKTLAKLVYKDLLNDERLSNIQPKFESSINVFYLSASMKQNPQVAFIPFPHSKDIDFGLIKALRQKLKDSQIFIAIVDNTGNILHYQIEEGFN